MPTTFQKMLVSTTGKPHIDTVSSPLTLIQAITPLTTTFDTAVARRALRMMIQRRCEAGNWLHTEALRKAVMPPGSSAVGSIGLA